MEDTSTLKIISITQDTLRNLEISSSVMEDGLTPLIKLKETDNLLLMNLLGMEKNFIHL